LDALTGGELAARESGGAYQSQGGSVVAARTLAAEGIGRMQDGSA